MHMLTESKATPAMVSAWLQRWVLLLEGCDYWIQYKAGPELANTNVGDQTTLLPTYSWPTLLDRMFCFWQKGICLSFSLDLWSRHWCRIWMFYKMYSLQRNQYNKKGSQLRASAFACYLVQENYEGWGMNNITVVHSWIPWDANSVILHSWPTLCGFLELLPFMMSFSQNVTATLLLCTSYTFSLTHSWYACLVSTRSSHKCSIRVENETAVDIDTCSEDISNCHQ